MAIPQPDLLTSSATAFQITPLLSGQSIPPNVTITATSAVAEGETEIPVVITPNTALLRNGLFILAGAPPNEQWIVLDADVAGNSSSLIVEPLKLPLPINSVLKTPEALPLIGLEGANLQLQTEMNSAVLMSNQGWQINDYSTGSWQFSGNLYIPRNNNYAVPAQTVIQGLIKKQNLWTQRVLPNGTLVAGMAMVSSTSDTTQGAQYVTISLTLQGSGKPIYKQLNQTPV